MKTLFWVLLAVALLEAGFLIYHFATYEHRPLPVEPVVTTFADSLRVYQGKLAELEQNAEQARIKLDRVGKLEWPSVHLRYVSAEQEIEHLRSVVKRWEQEQSADAMTELYHEAVAVYGRAAGLVLAASYDTLIEPEGTVVSKKRLIEEHR